MRLNIVVAMASNRVIGHEGDLPWRLSADLKRFKAITLGHPIVMGRKTHESIGRALPGRLNIVLSRSQAAKIAKACVQAYSLDEAIRLGGDAQEIMIVGGAAVYDVALPRVERIYLTEVHTEVAGDTRFPILDAKQWHERSRERHAADDSNEFDYSFIVLEREGACC